MMLAVTDNTFNKEISKELTLVQFWAPWCGPCKMQTPILENIEEDYQGEIKFLKINIDENPVISNQFDIMSIPHMLILRNGIKIDSFIGYHQKETVKEILNKHI